MPSKSLHIPALGSLCRATLVAALSLSWPITSQPQHLVPPLTRATLNLPVPQFAEPIIAIREPSTRENVAFQRAVADYNEASPDDLQAFELFLASNPDSPRRVCLLTNLGLSYYHYGYFSKALAAWERAWADGQSISEPRVKAIVDRAIGELVRMHARLGHADRVAALLQEVGDRHVTGPATEAITGAREGLWTMKHDPGIAYLCGPMALKNLLTSIGVSARDLKFIDGYRSGVRGVTLAQVAQLAERAHIAYRLIFRRPSEPVPVPSLIHWKESHFAAILEETNGRYRVKDPTFGSDLWISRNAINAEASGYFLVVAENGGGPWRDVRTADVRHIRGMGYTTSNDPSATTPNDITAQGTGNNCGMCGYSFTEMLVSLRLTDTPVGYTPPIGPDAHVTLSYNQREASQPAVFQTFNISPKWSFNWLAYIEDDPTGASTPIHHVGGGGTASYYRTDPYEPLRDARDGALLVQTSAQPIAYERRSGDGSIEVYAESNGATKFPRLVFLSKLTDRAGNTATLQYDTSHRLISFTDATNRATHFFYDLPSFPLLITRITDPFGRTAQLTYDSLGRLTQITDVIGLNSTFVYDQSGLISTLTTAYGATRFEYGDNGNSRFLQATDPLGNSERLEYVQGLTDMPDSDPPDKVPHMGPTLYNVFLRYRNTYYWDKHAYSIAFGTRSNRSNSDSHGLEAHAVGHRPLRLPTGTPDRHLLARIRHWTHNFANGNQTGRTIESEKYPLENRVWFTYPDQSSSGGAAVQGSLDKPTGVGRVLDDGSTQLVQAEYNVAGNITRRIDAVGRETVFEYDPTNIDIVRVKQRTSPTDFATIAEVSYNMQHLPVSFKGADGGTATFVRNRAGQLLQSTDPSGDVRKYEYDPLGYLSRVVNANQQTEATYTYDGLGRVTGRADSEGYALKYEYDGLDRLSATTFPDGTKRTFAYDKLDFVAVTDRQGRITKYKYNPLRNLIQVTDALNRQTQLEYYDNGTRKSTTDPNGNRTTWDIDLQSRVISTELADGTKTRWQYENTTSRLHSSTDALGQVQQFSYTADGRVVGLAYISPQHPTPNVTFSYDPYFARLSSMTDGNGTSVYRYYPVGTLGALHSMAEDGPYQNDSIFYTYDELGRIKSQTIGTSVEAFAYDSLGRRISDSGPLGTFDFSYVGDTNQLTGRALRGGAVGTTYQYDSNTGDRRLIAIANAGGRTFTYSRTVENLVKQIQESGSVNGRSQPATWNLTYDAGDRLVASMSTVGTEFTYAYDPADNILAVHTPGADASASYNALNEVTTFAGDQFAYDLDGNLIDDGSRLYTWDAAGRLIGVTSKSVPSNVTTFKYDGLGRRVAIVSNGVETRYLWCGDAICQARTSSDIPIRYYYREGEYRPGSGDKYFYLPDQLGSVRDIANVGGSLVASYDYDPYGRTTESAGTPSADMRFAGMFYEQNTGLYLTRYRAYDPRIGRWISRDPVYGTIGTDFKGSGDLYTYVSDDPVNFVDPSGLQGSVADGGVPGGIGIPRVTPVIPPRPGYPDAGPPDAPDAGPPDPVPVQIPNPFRDVFEDRRPKPPVIFLPSPEWIESFLEGLGECAGRVVAPFFVPPPPPNSCERGGKGPCVI